MADYKEGVDYEMVLMKNQPKGGTNKTRRFFTKAEKAAKSAPKAAPAKAKPSTPTKAAKASVAPTQDAMKGYRKGDVVTSPLPQDIAAATRKAIAIPAKAPVKQPNRPISRTPTKKPNSVMSAIGSAIGKFEGQQRKPVDTPESKGTTNPLSRASGAVGGALGSFAVKLTTGHGAAAKAPNRAEAYKLQQKKKKK